MRRRLAWLVGGLGIAGLVRALSRRPQPVLEAGPDRRAEELKRRLDEAKPLAAEVDEADAAETTVDAAADPPPTPSRGDVHGRARAAIDEMRRSGADEGGDTAGEAARDA
jgi:hypothetical protein